jgi:hypothetical protein
MDKVLTFGKYKGEPVKKIILTHIGYIMWCLSNLTWFKLDTEEQDLYDAVALSILDSDCETIYPKENLKPYIANPSTEPIFGITRNGVIYVKSWAKNSPIVKSIMKYRTIASGHRLDLSGLMNSLNKMFIVSGDDDTVDYDDFFN